MTHTPETSAYNFSKTLSIAHLDLGFAPKKFPMHMLRKIVSSVAGKMNDAFHNHDLGTGKVIYRQPYIYYYQKDNGNFCMTAIGPGIEVLKEWYAAGAPVNFKGTDMIWRTTETEFFSYDYELKMHPELRPLPYYIENYLALNTKNYQRFQSLNFKSQQKAFLANILSQHIHTFAESFEWNIPAYLNICHIEDFRMHSNIKHDKIKGLKAFEIVFHSPLQLPNGIFLGKRSSLGFGHLKTRNIF